MTITYTPTTNFGAKDSLPTNDPAKVIKGAEFSTEFTAIQTAFGQAAPVASPTFTGNATFDGGTLYVDSANNRVGVGTVAPQNPFHVAAASAGALDLARFRLEGATNNPMLKIEADEANQTAGLDTSGSTATSLTLSTSGTERVRVDTSGNVGIGTTPEYFVDAYRDANDNAPTLALRNVNAGASAASRLYMEANGNNFNIYVNGDGTTNANITQFRSTAGSSQFTFETASQERMRIDDGGNLLVGTASVTGGVGNGARVTGGIFSTNNGTTTVPSATWTTLATIPTGNGIYLVTAYLPNSGDPAGYNAVSLITTSLTATNLIDIKNANQVSLRMSGSSFQVNHGQGTTQPINWSILRLA